MDDWIAPLLTALALPRYGLSTVFVIAFVSATLLPMGSEPAVFGLVKLNPDLFWPAVVVATAGNTLGGALTWWMGYGAERAYERVTKNPGAAHPRALRWLERFGASACLLSWLPVVGDPVYGRPRYDRVRDPLLKKRLSEFPRQALHAERIAFRHPVSNETMEIVAPVPADMKDLITAVETAALRLSS